MRHLSNQQVPQVRVDSVVQHQTNLLGAHSVTPDERLHIANFPHIVREIVHHKGQHDTPSITRSGVEHLLSYFDLILQREVLAHNNGHGLLLIAQVSINGSLPFPHHRVHGAEEGLGGGGALVGAVVGRHGLLKSVGLVVQAIVFLVSLLVQSREEATNAREQDVVLVATVLKEGDNKSIQLSCGKLNGIAVLGRESSENISLLLDGEAQAFVKKLESGKRSPFRTRSEQTEINS
mmetsp:Transcript_20509/g.41234  ORF Transcript_20509/g.41234 Transcript_20509/m.41234 type:complete len:235 (+) Transcript_20509:272-976(+)